MTTTILDILDELRASATSERDKGDKFERLIQAYLKTDTVYANKYSDVWLWNEYPRRDNKPDTGIDLVAQDRETGELTAIQCKFYAPDHYLLKSDLDSFFTASGKSGFASRLVVSTTDRWSKHAEDALEGQQLPVSRMDVRMLDESNIDWSQFSLATPEVMASLDQNDARQHQITAVSDVRAGFGKSDRGKLIMACGTGKTFTALKITEDLVPIGGNVLFLVPSISLLSQSLREWSAQARVPLRTFAVCSDVKAGKRTKSEDIGPYDLAFPASTDATKLLNRVRHGDTESKITVVFSTYQSIGVVAQSQQLGMPGFDLVICDEAHRTTGVTLADEDESAFVQVHDNSYLRARRRLYMTATPRLYDDASKTKATEAGAMITGMDDASNFGPEFHRLGFGEAVEKGLLSDYKVSCWQSTRASVSAQFQAQFADDNYELKLDDAAKIVGCWNGLAKRNLDEGRLGVSTTPMRRAVAFARSIKDSQRISGLFTDITDKLAADSDLPNPLRCEAEHVDGTFNVLERNKKLDWLKAERPAGVNSCRVLSNARCLTEGVDVPALDAVLFLNPRNSVVDVVQSVGRVMRKAKDKEYGYVILPVGRPGRHEP